MIFSLLRDNADKLKTQFQNLFTGVYRWWDNKAIAIYWVILDVLDVLWTRDPGTLTQGWIQEKGEVDAHFLLNKILYLNYYVWKLYCILK